MMYGESVNMNNYIDKKGRKRYPRQLSLFIIADFVTRKDGGASGDPARRGKSPFRLALVKGQTRRNF